MSFIPRDLLKTLEGFDARWRLPIRVAGWFLIGGTSALTALYLSVPLPNLAASFASASTGVSGSEVQVPQEEDGVRHIPIPNEVRGFYMTSYSAASPKLRSDLFAYAKRNHLNAVVIDVKDGGGLLSFMPTSPSLKAFMPEKSTIPDLDAVLAEAADNGLYRIARVFVFQDPNYVQRFPAEAIQKNGGGVWSDFKGVTWVDPASKAAWRYNVEVAREVYARGFDEVQFDYIRFPSDGAMSTIRYDHYDGKTPKHEVIRDFFNFMHRELEEKGGIPISFDLFGYVTWYVDFDLGIGQLLVDALPNATAISAMVYPSHYSVGSLGFTNPADHPYDIIADSLKKAGKLYQRRDQECADLAAGAKSATSTFLLPCEAPLAQHRPWIQAFDIGAVYNADMINAEIKAVRDQGGKGFLLWNARNVYRDFYRVPTATSTAETK